MKAIDYYNFIQEQKIVQEQIKEDVYNIVKSSGMVTYSLLREIMSPLKEKRFRDQVLQELIQEGQIEFTKQYVDGRMRNCYRYIGHIEIKYTYPDREHKHFK